ncbi:MAG: sigma-E processing peptidase SpoIIGA [Ruminiclostridium sp.]|nr:sigma-E processing peptidase SpoIIGA [Ruminiclostridium sp.]
MRVIYLDILLLLNFYITYFLVVSVSVIMHLRLRLRRRLLAAGVGALTSLAIFLPTLSFLPSLLLKLAASSVIVPAAFGFGGIKVFLRNTAVFFLLNCLFAGVMLCLWLFVCPGGMMYNNGVSYFDIPLWLALAATAAAYLTVRLIRRVMDSKTVLDKKYTLEIVTEKGSVSLSAAPDSGNRLTDFFTGLPVIFCDLDKCRHICPEGIAERVEGEERDSANIKGIRLIPCSTVSGGTMAVCFKPDKIIIDDGNQKKEVDALAGFTKTGLGGEEAIFNPAIL